MFPILNLPSTFLPIPSLWVIPVHQPWAPCIMHQTWIGNPFHIWYYTCFNAILSNHPTLAFSFSRVFKGKDKEGCSQLRFSGYPEGLPASVTTEKIITCVGCPPSPLPSTSAHHLPSLPLPSPLSAPQNFTKSQKATKEPLDPTQHGLSSSRTSSPHQLSSLPIASPCFLPLP